MPRLENRQSRSAGTYVTNEVAAPQRGQGEATKYIASLDPAPADLNDSSLSIDLTVEGSIDGTNWQLLAQGTGWAGGTVGRDGTVRPPRVGWAASDNRALTKVRVRWTQNKTASVGCSLDTELVSVAQSAVR